MSGKYVTSPTTYVEGCFMSPDSQLHHLQTRLRGLRFTKLAETEPEALTWGRHENKKTTQRNNRTRIRLLTSGPRAWFKLSAMLELTWSHTTFPLVAYTAHF